MRLRFLLYEGTITLGGNSVFIQNSEAEVSDPFASELKQQGLAWDAPPPAPIVEEKHVEPAEAAEEEQPIAEEAKPEVEEGPPVQPTRAKGRRKKISTITEVK